MLDRDMDLAAGGSIDPAIVERGDIVERFDLVNDGDGVASAEIAKRYDLQFVLCHPL